MKVFSGDLRSGKSTQIYIEVLKHPKTNVKIMTFSREAAKNMFESFLSFLEGQNLTFEPTFSTLTVKVLGKSITFISPKISDPHLDGSVYVDELQKVFKGFFPKANVKMVTIDTTTEGEKGDMYD